MSAFKRYTDLKYEDKNETIQEVLQTQACPIVARMCHLGEKTSDTELQPGKEFLIQQSSEEIFAHIRVLAYYNNDQKEKQLGAEYVLEHETFVGNEYLMPVGFGRVVKYVRRPGSRGRYLSIKEVIADSPAFVRTETETRALSSDATRTVTIPAKTVLELKRISHESGTKISCLECTDGNTIYTFRKGDNVNVSFEEKNRLYSLSDVSRTSLLPKVILFQDVCPEDIVLADNEMRSALVTIADGPIEILRFVKVKYITCWIRNKKLRTYETVLIPQTLWNKTDIQLRMFHTEEDKQRCLSRKYGPCVQSEFLSSSLYMFPLNLRESVGLRSPEFFKQKMDGNTFFDVIKVSFTYSSDEEDGVYSEIMEEHRPPVPDRKRAGNPKISKGDSTPTSIVRSLPKVPSEEKEQQYTQLEFTKGEQFYEKLGVHDEAAPKVVPLGYTDNPVDKTEQYIEIKQVRKVLDDKQTKEDFFKYSVKEVSFCFEHCGLKNLAEVCYGKKLDGSFFKGFDDWKALNLSTLDVIILKKVIYEGWRSNDDSAYNVNPYHVE